MLIKPVATNVSRGIDRGTYNGKSTTLNGVDQYLSNTFSVNDGDTFTLSYWVKFHELDRSQTHFGNTGSAALFHHSTNAMGINDDGATDPKTTELQRDTSGWHHVVFNGNGTTNNLWINNVAQTFTATNVGDLNTAVAHYFGYNASYGYAHISIADLYFCSSNAYTPDYFAHESADTGKWVITDVNTVEASISYGSNNGCHLIFDDNANDSSGKGNNWTENGSPIYTSDTPVDNHATLNALTLTTTGTLSEGNTRLAASSTSAKTLSTLPLLADYTYWEFTNNSSNRSCIGIVGSPYLHDNNDLGYHPTEYGFQMDGNKNNNNSSSSFGVSIGSGETGCIAFDNVNGAIYVGKISGTTITWMNSGDPTSGASATGAMFSGLSGTFIPALARQTSSGDASINFGASGFTATNIPDGYVASSSANLPTDGTISIDSVMQIVTATEDNIISDTNTAVSGYTNWIKWLKNRDSAESHYFIFSDDTSNYISSDDAANGKQSLPSLSGSDDWVGYCFNSDGVNINMGTQSHTNGGGDTTVTHGLGSTNIAIFMLDEAGGDFHVFHPQLDSGKLVYFDKDNVTQTTDSAIKNVTSTSFDIDTSEATGTKRWFVFNGDAPCIDLSIFTGNVNTDGAFAPMKLQPRMLFGYSLTATAYDWILNDSVRPSNNTVRADLYPNENLAEATSGTSRIDLNSNGAKNRDNGANWNDANEHITIAFGIPIAA